jgi:hypothetical protein
VVQQVQVCANVLPRKRLGKGERPVKSRGVVFRG